MFYAYLDNMHFGLYDRVYIIGYTAASGIVYAIFLQRAY